jgi:hypothetical protein
VVFLGDNRHLIVDTVRSPDRRDYVVSQAGTMESEQPISGRGSPLILVDLHGWRRVWYRRVMVNSIVFHTFAWFNRSVPVTKGRLNRLMHLGGHP